MNTCTKDPKTNLSADLGLDAFGQPNTAPYRVARFGRGHGAVRWVVYRGATSQNPHVTIGTFPNAGLARLFIDALNAKSAATGGDLVPVAYGCPACGERSMNALVWMSDDGEQITCARCGTFYEIDLV